MFTDEGETADSGTAEEESEQSDSSDESGEESILTEDLSEDTGELLTALETDHYAFRAQYTFSSDGLLSGVRVDGTRAFLRRRLTILNTASSMRLRSLRTIMGYPA